MIRYRRRHSVASKHGVRHCCVEIVCSKLRVHHIVWIIDINRGYLYDWTRQPLWILFHGRIFFLSLGFDVKDHYKDLGGNHAAFYAPLADLNGLRAYQAVDADGLHLLGTVVVDYRGYRVTAQSIIPGTKLFSSTQNKFCCSICTRFWLLIDFMHHTKPFNMELMQNRSYWMLYISIVPKTT